MYYVLDGTERCGLYECSRCHDRFLDARIVPKMICPGCALAASSAANAFVSSGLCVVTCRMSASSLFRRLFSITSLPVRRKVRRTRDDKAGKKCYSKKKCRRCLP